jgi:hypothetical protein
MKVMKKSDISGLNTLVNLGLGNFQGIDTTAVQQRTLTMQQDLIQKLQHRFTTYPDLAIQQAIQAFNNSYSVTEDLCEYLSRQLQMALWLDNPDILNNPAYDKEAREQITEQAKHALERLLHDINYLKDKKISLISTSDVLQSHLAVSQINAQQIEQDFPKLVKTTQLVEQADLLLQQVTDLLASKQQISNIYIQSPRPTL